MMVIFADYPPDFLASHRTVTVYTAVWAVNQSVLRDGGSREVHPSEKCSVTDFG